MKKQSNKGALIAALEMSNDHMVITSFFAKCSDCR